MSVDKLVDSTQLDSDLTSVANAIRTKGGTSAQLAFPSGFVSAINDISGGTTVVDKLQAIANGDWNPGYTVDSSGVMQYLCGNSIYTVGMACVLTPILPIYDGELNITYYIENKTPSGSNINKINIISTAASYHLYKGTTKSSYYSMTPTSGGNTFNTVISRGSGKNVDNAYDGVKFCVWLYGCEESYCYANETGRILFAGRNSQYYGKTYITDP